ncbi:MAG: primosomal protein N' [Clostridia bacterium]|nr:primosomal protein N' [Clostridia bacterium]
MQSTSVFVRLLDAPYSLDVPYSYTIPEHLADEIRTGVFVTVPFGGGNRRRAAVVVGFSDKTEHVSENGKIIKLKPVLSVTQERYALSDEQLGLCSFICSTTLCSFGDAVHAILPSAAMSSLVEFYLAEEKVPRSDSGIESEIYAYVKRNYGVTAADIKKEFGTDALDIITGLKKRGYIRSDFRVNGPKNDKYVKYYSLAIGEEEASLMASGESKRLRTSKQRAIVGHLLNYGRVDGDTLQRQLSVTSAQIKNLCEKEIIREEKVEEYRDPYLMKKSGKREENILSSEQGRAYAELDELYSSNEARAALLYGVTGSGKTRVIKAMVDRVLSDGRQVIILVPEISLTPQTVDIFCGYYGDRVTVIHSSLSAGERYDAYKRIADGKSDVVIGTRSAVFAPLDRLGMIVIDEEQEHTYKSDSNPKYHARDIARYRAVKHNALMLLASATPSIESFYRAKTGKYKLVTLKNRYGDAVLPSVEIVNMCRESAGGNLSPMSETLMGAVAEAKDNGRQSILFLNRRGYSHFAMCRMCGEVVECPHCSVSLTYHTKKGTKVANNDILSRAKNGYLVCHYCGYRREVPTLCPSCGSEHIAFLGYGTQKIENDLSDIFKSSSILRMDNDTTQSKFAYEDILGSFRNKEADILLGTQMVTKGHDFPEVTVVGVLDADSTLHLDDYRAGEKTFSLITQVVGRAGRGKYPGRAIIQTHMPDNETIRLAADQDYEAFYEKEILLRKNYLFPPFCDIVLLTATADDEIELGNGMIRLSEGINAMVTEEYADTPIVAFGPFEAPIYKLDGRYRMRMVFKCKLNARSRELFSRVLRQLSHEISSKITLSLDTNPSGI